MNDQMLPSRQHRGFAPESLNLRAPVAAIAAAPYEESYEGKATPSDPGVLIGIASLRLDRGDLDGDDLARRLSALPLAGDLLGRAAEELHALRAEVAGLRNHTAVVEARGRAAAPAPGGPPLRRGRRRGPRDIRRDRRDRDRDLRAGGHVESRGHPGSSPIRIAPTIPRNPTGAGQGVRGEAGRTTKWKDLGPTSVRWRSSIRELASSDCWRSASPSG